MKSLIVSCALLLLLLSPAYGLQVLGRPLITRVEDGQLHRIRKEPTLDLCPTCVSFLEQAINQLLNIILNAGVIGGCADLCGKLPNKVEATVCNLLCDYVGIKEFINLIEKADIDPIYMCELMKICPIHDGGAANITSLEIAPKQGPVGTTFTIAMTFTITKETGTGETVVQVIPPVGFPIGAGELNEGFKPGNYSVGWKLQAEPSEQDPFTPGTYKVEVAVCYGECGSKHPHSEVLSQAQGSFQITGNSKKH